MRAKTIVKDNLHNTAGMGRGHAQANIKNKGARVRARGLQCRLITGAQPKAGTGLKMQTVRFFNVTLLGIYR